MSRTTTVRKYGKSVRKTRAEELFAQLPKSPLKNEPVLEPELRLEQMLESSSEPETTAADEVTRITEQLVAISFDETGITEKETEIQITDVTVSEIETTHQQPEEPHQHGKDEEREQTEEDEQGEQDVTHDQTCSYDDLLVLAWDDVCPAGNRIEKIAEASYAEVYRITNEHGTSIIKVVRLESPIKPQTKAQERSGLVDEEPHTEEDMFGELRISEWLADIPGFVVYKERYVVKGKAPKALLETHQVFHRRMKRKDPDRLQFYPSPSRYLNDTRFLVVDLGDAVTALEDFQLTSISQVWDIFLHTALALARAEDLIEFEVRPPPFPHPTSPRL
jgi:serine/threonine-protein kinase haspin